MDPQTAITLASMAYSVLAPKGDDPNRAILKMLEALNQKLNIINDKLDLIIQEISLLPHKIEYQRQNQNLKASIWQTKLLFQNYISDCLIDPINGENIFIQNKGDEIELELRRIRDSFSYLSQFKDIVSINLCCVAIACDNELTNLLKLPDNYILDINKHYHNFLKQTLYLSDYDKLTDEKFEVYHNDLNSIWNNYGNSYSNGQMGAFTLSRWRNTFELKQLNSNEENLLKMLYLKGHLKDHKTFFYTYLSKEKISEKGISHSEWLQRKEPYLINSTGQCAPPYVRNRWFKANFKEQFENTQNELLARYSTKELLIMRLIQIQAIIN